VNGGTADATANGGTTAFSTATDTASLTVTSVNDSPIANDDSAIVAEDSGATTIDVLANDSILPDTGETLTIAAVTQGANGAVLITGGGTLVSYAPNADFFGTDSFTYTVDDGNGGIATATVNVTVTGVNDPPTVAAPAAIGVVEDVASPLAGIAFGDVDAGTNPVTATFTVARGALSATAAGGVAVGGAATALTLTGTVADLNAFLAAGGLSYTTALDDSSPAALAVQLDDLGNTGSGGSLTSPIANVTLNVTPVNDAPVFGNLALSIDAGGTVVLTGANLSATDVDDPAPSLVFFIGSLQNGRFELVGAPGLPITTFTQGQLQAGLVQFVQTDPFDAPSFVVFVTDGASTVGPATVAVSFRPTIGVGQQPTGTRDATALPSVVLRSAAIAASTGGVNEPFAIRFSRTPLELAASGGEPVATAELPVTPAGARALAAGLGVAWPGGSRGGELGFGEMQGLSTSLPKLDFRVPSQRHDDEASSFDLGFGSARLAGIGLSVGVMWWVARAGGLLASLIASTPVWRHMDPLPVLGRDDERVGWGEPEAEETEEEETSAGELFTGSGSRRT
jgi:VCBS repeat-containing protein